MRYIMCKLKSILYALPIIASITHMCHGANLNVAWDANDEGDLSGYKVYYGTSSGNYGSAIDVENVTEYALSGLTGRETYYIAITAYDTSNNESEKSDEVSGVAQSPTSTTTTVIPTTTTTPATSTIPVTTTMPIITTTAPPSTTTSMTPTTTTTPVTTTIPPDAIPPTGTITINNGDQLTYSPNVILTLFATDNDEELGGNAIMTFSNDNQAWSVPEPYATNKTWTLQPTEGEKTVFVKFRDAAGNWMTEPAKDQIRLEASEDICDDPHKLQPVSLTVSSEFLPFWTKARAVDGDTISLWSSAPTPFWENEFIALDLGKVKQISRIDMYASKLFILDFFPVNFQIEISGDNINWEEVCTEKNYNLRSAHSDSWDMNNPQARYLRVHITKAKTFFIFYLAQIAEIEVYGCDIPEQHLPLPDDRPSVEDEKPGDDNQEEAGEAAEVDPGLPSVPGKPVITFN